MKLVSVLIILLLLPQISHAQQVNSALRQKLKYLSQNQAVISKNLANANTPGYKTLELEQPKYNNGNKKTLALATTSKMHIGQLNNNGNYRQFKQKDVYETAPNGNNVSIEEQMVKMSANDMEHMQVVNLLRKLSSLKNIAIGER